MTVIMSDSVCKNLKIEVGVVETLELDYKPIHHLCKSHLLKAFDWSTLKVLANVENQLNFRKKLETINSAVRSFLCGEKSVPVCGMKSILNPISHYSIIFQPSRSLRFHFTEREASETYSPLPGKKIHKIRLFTRFNSRFIIIS